jgi:hypothetical protein
MRILSLRSVGKSGFRKMEYDSGDKALHSPNFFFAAIISYTRLPDNFRRIIFHAGVTRQHKKIITQAIDIFYN